MAGSVGSTLSAVAPGDAERADEQAREDGSDPQRVGAGDDFRQQPGQADPASAEHGRRHAAFSGPPAPKTQRQPPPADVAASTPAARRNSILDREAFVIAARVDGYSHIWAQVIGEPNALQLTAGDWDDRNPVVSPGMDTMAFASKRAGNWDLYLMDLETGSVPAFAAAHSFYQKAGFSYCGPFADYIEDRFSRFMMLKL